MPPLLKAIDPAVRPSVIALTPAGLPLTLGRWPFPVGTDPNNTSYEDGTFFTFKDPIISRVHTKFVFYPSDGTIRICDQKSTNGTIVNGIRIEPGQDVPLKDGDMVAFGGGGGFYIGEFVGNPAAGTPYIYRFSLTDASDQHGNKRQREDVGEPLYSRPEQRRRLSNGGEGSSGARLALTAEGSSTDQDGQDHSVSPQSFALSCYGSAYNGSSLVPPLSVCLESPPVDSEIQKELISPTQSTASTEHKENESAVTGHQKLLSDLTSEFDCAICCNLMVAPHTVNPCGHMFCGLCLIGWFKLNKSTCPECRADVSTSSQPMIPAFKMNTVIDMIAKSSLSDSEKLEHKKRASEWQVHLDEKRKIDEAAKKAKLNAPNPPLQPSPLSHGRMGMLIRQQFMQMQPHQNFGDILRHQQQQHQRAQLMQEQMQEQMQAQTARVQAQAQILARQRAARADLEGRVAQERRVAEERRTVAETARRFLLHPTGEDLTAMLRLPNADRFLGGRGEGSANPIDLTQSSDNDMNDEYSVTSDSSDAEHDGPEIQSINIERARSGRSTCRTCHTIIANGELRWAVHEEDTVAYYNTTKFHHLGCYGVPTEYGFGADDVRVEAPAGMSVGESEAIRRALQT